MAASFFSSVRSGFGRQSNKSNNSSSRGQGTPSPTSLNSPSGSLPPSVPPVPQSPSLSSSMSFDAQGGSEASPPATRRPPYFFREEYANLIVKGNFMTLAARPQLVEQGEWLAHQVVEQYRLLEQMIDIIKVVDERTGRPICNPDTCPTMSAAGHTYTWLDNNKKPIKIPAIQYIQLVQKWIVGKINDPAIFPTDTTFSAMHSHKDPSVYASGSVSTPGSEVPIRAGPTSLNAPLSQLSGSATRDWLGKSSGFPESFEGDIKGIYRQMMRCYAHIYHGHWLDPFWNISAYKELNTCFIHFVNVGKLFGLIGEKEFEPMQPLIDLWAAKGWLAPPQSASGQASGTTSAAQKPEGSASGAGTPTAQ